MVTFIEEKKKQKRLIYIMAVALLITFFVLWQGFLRQSGVIPKEGVMPVELKKVEIDFAILESPVLKGLSDFEPISQFEEKIGRENPFLPLR